MAVRLPPNARRVARRSRYAILRPARSLLRRLLVGYARGGRRASGLPDARVTFLLTSAWGMGGTIRTVQNLAAYLAASRPVEILSLVRLRQESFFDVPGGVTMTALDDRRQEATQGLAGRLRNVLAAKQSVLFRPEDHPEDAVSLWTDVRLARCLRGRGGVLVGTRPSLNFLLAEARSPGTVAVGQEHLNLASHDDAIRAAIRELYPRLDTLVVLTEGEREPYRRLTGGELRVEAIPNAAAELPGPKADLAAPRALAAGRLTEQKGFDLLIDAWSAARLDGWSLRICGKGPLRKHLRRRAAERGVAETVELPGARDLAEEMAAASVFVLSSRFEGFPLVLLEAMGKGMAVVAFDCPTGPGDILRDDENGLLVPDGDVEALASAIRRMAEDEGLRRRCGAAAIETSAEYAMNAIGPRWLTLLDELAQRTPRLPGTGR